jgi:hypothetical protein
MLNPEHRSQAMNTPAATTKIAAQAQLFRTRHREFFPGSKQDLLRALVMREVLGEPKCKQSSSRKQF